MHLYSGGGGLVSTAADYLRFAQMLANGGELDGIRILGPKTIQLMSMNQLPDGVTAPWDKLQGHGYGFAMSVLTDIAKSLTVGSVGDFGWDGAASTYFRIDPEEDLVILLMTHRQPCDTEIQVKLKTLVYQALTD
ncbi:MAG: serine hydrolase [Acidobacteriota bacterium]